MLSLAGLAANLTTSLLFLRRSRDHWSFRAALAHELSDASLTIAALIGALLIQLFGIRWVDPGLSLLIAVWLLTWAGRQSLRRIRLGRSAWGLG